MLIKTLIVQEVRVGSQVGNIRFTNVLNFGRNNAEHGNIVVKPMMIVSTAAGKEYSRLI